MAKVKIENKIVGYRVSTEEKPQVNETPEQITQEEPNVVRMHERLERPEMLRGTTYKIKPPVSDPEFLMLCILIQYDIIDCDIHCMI